MEAWQRFNGAGNVVYATGFSGASGVQMAIGNVYAPHHLVYWYLCQPREMTITMTANGVFEQSGVLDRIERSASEAFVALIPVATNYCIVNDMYAQSSLFHSSVPADPAAGTST